MGMDYKLNVKSMSKLYFPIDKNTQVVAKATEDGFLIYTEYRHWYGWVKGLHNVIGIDIQAGSPPKKGAPRCDWSSMRSNGWPYSWTVKRCYVDEFDLNKEVQEFIDELKESAKNAFRKKEAIRKAIDG